ncbi:hypothetical protein UVUMRFZT_CDS0223 [Staphylococcus phage LJLAME001]
MPCMFSNKHVSRVKCYEILKLTKLKQKEKS